MVQNAAKEEKDIRSVNIEQGCSHTKLGIIGLLSTRPGVLQITALGSFKLHYIFIALLWKLVRQSQIVQSVMYSYDAVISSYVTPAIHS